MRKFKLNKQKIIMILTAILAILLAVAVGRNQPKNIMYESYEKLLEVFFSMHDPTTVDQQGADVGSQYRSVIFTHSEEQARKARAAIAALDASGVWRDPVVTEVRAADTFWEAEDYHHDYYAQNPRQGYCQMVVRPKAEKLKRVFADLLREDGGEKRSGL